MLTGGRTPQPCGRVIPLCRTAGLTWRGGSTSQSWPVACAGFASQGNGKMKFNMQAEQERKWISSRNKNPPKFCQHILFNIQSSRNVSGYKTSENQHSYIDISWAGLQDFSQFMKTLKPLRKTLFFLHLIGLVLFLHVKLLNLMLFH